MLESNLQKCIFNWKLFNLAHKKSLSKKEKEREKKGNKTETENIQINWSIQNFQFAFKSFKQQRFPNFQLNQFFSLFEIFFEANESHFVAGEQFQYYNLQSQDFQH